MIIVYVGIGIAIGVGLMWSYDRAFGSRKTINQASLPEPSFTPPMPVVPPPKPGIDLQKEITYLAGDTHAPMPCRMPPPLEKTVEQKIADTNLPFADRLNLRYDFADVKISLKLQIMTWKNAAGKRMQAPLITGNPTDTWRRACTLIEDSIYDVKTVRKIKKCATCGHDTKFHTIMAPMDYAGCTECGCSEYKASA